MQAAVRVLRDVGIKRRTSFDTGTVVFNHFLEGLETSIVHVASSQCDVPQRGRSEFAGISFNSGDLCASTIKEGGIQAVVGKALALEQRSAVAMKAICAKLPQARVVFGHEQGETTLLFFGQCRFTFERSIELRVEGGQSEQECLDCQPNLLRRDLRRSESRIK